MCIEIFLLNLLSDMKLHKVDDNCYCTIGKLKAFFRLFSALALLFLKETRISSEFHEMEKLNLRIISCF